MKLDKSKLSFLNQLESEIILLDRDFSVIWLNDSALSKGWVLNSKKEGNLILSKIDNSDEVVLLDDKGKMFSSIDFSSYLSEKMNRSTKSLILVVGGAFGFSDAVYQRANNKLSLSKMTFSHQMVRLIFKEQLYRAFTILKGEKYHHD